MASADEQKLSAKMLQDMIQADYDQKYKRYETTYNSTQPGASPSDISFQKTNEIYATLATPLKNMRAQAMRDAAASCFKDKWMDEAVPNPHQVEMCRERMQNRHMGLFYRNLVELRESNRYKYQDCIVDANNDMQKAVICVRNYLTGIDADNATLTSLVHEKCGKYL